MNNVDFYVFVFEIFIRLICKHVTLFLYNFFHSMMSLLYFTLPINGNDMENRVSIVPYQ